MKGAIAMAKVLLIDDDVDFVEMNKAVLTSKGFEVSEAYSAAEARGKIEDVKPDLIVLDVMMETGLAGFDLAREISTLHPQLPIIMLTGIREAKDLKFAFEPDETWLPVTTFLEKPINPSDLAERVEEILGN
jgi:CheY-like chemotaxis protein